MTRWLCMLLVPAAALCAQAATVDPAPQRPGWKLVWAEEFNTNGAPDPAKWGYERGFVRNQERQYYTTARAENARVEKGMLVIEARKEAFEKADITSASLTTEGKATWTYGRFEVRAQIPAARGTWPAIWMLGTSHRARGWPRCGEIDIMEHVGFATNRIHATLHTAAFNHTKGTGRGSSIVIGDATQAFHVYALEWHPDRIEMFVDDRKYLTVRKDAGHGEAEWPFDQPFYLLLNLAIGGAWGGQKGVDEAAFPQRFLVDYVRVYQPAGR